MDSRGHLNGPYGSVFCNYCGGNHFSYHCPSKYESLYFMGDSNLDTSHLNVFTQSWEEHPNLLFNDHDHGTFTSPPPPSQDWNNTDSNNFDQSWEEHFDYYDNSQEDDFNNSPSVELIEALNSFEAKMDYLLENMNNNFQSNQTQQNDIENSNCAGKDEGEVNTLEDDQETDIFEGAYEHLTNPSSLQNIEEVPQNAEIITTPLFEFVQEKHIVADTDEFVQQDCVENLQIIFKTGRDNQSQDSRGFTKSCPTVGKVMWNNLRGMNSSPICAIEIWCHDQGIRHKWKEKVGEGSPVGGAY